MPRVGISELVTLGRVIAKGQLLRYRGGEHGFTTKFEENLQKHIGVNHALTVNSGTNALIAALVGVVCAP